MRIPYGRGFLFYCMVSGILTLSAPFAWSQQVLNDLKVHHSTATGFASFLTAKHGGNIPVDPVAGQTEPTPAAFLSAYAHLFGIANPSTQLVERKVELDFLGHTHTSYAQVHKGISVFSGAIKIHQDADGEFMAANGDFYEIQDKLSTTPTTSATQAELIARSRLRVGPLKVYRSQLVIVDPGWYGDAPIGPHLAYHIELGDPARGVAEAFFIDARNGRILDQWTLRHTAKNRAIFDGQNGGSLPGVLVRAEGDTPVSLEDANRAYDYYGDTYDYFFRAFGRDGIDDNGLTMVATVNWDPGGFCPNAAWSGFLQQMVFCTGTVTDDIVGHELTHGVTELTANLIYQNQSGQLNESFSDVFGEMIDLFNGNAAFSGTPGGTPWPSHETGPGLDKPNNGRTGCSPTPGYDDGVRWRMGEDAAAFGGAIRDMWIPSCDGDPDRANDPLNVCPIWDNGGVHIASGVPNHAFAILTDGDSFNGFDVTGIGPIKAGAVWYRALSVYLNQASDFDDAFAAFNQAASDLVGTFPNDPRTGLASDSMFTTADLVQVDNALRAVEMDTAGRCGRNTPVLSEVAPTKCLDKIVIFSDDFESGDNGWTVSNDARTPYNWTLLSALPDNRSGTAWFCEDRDIGDCGAIFENGLHSLICPAITLPSGSFSFATLSFTHSVRTENRWDGGNVKIKVNGGAWQVVPHEAFIYNSYNPVPLFGSSDFNDNPLADEPAFTGISREWGTSLAVLDNLAGAGDTIQIRFDFGKDCCCGADGWYVDDFEIYHCGTTGDCNANGIPDDVDAMQLAAPELLLNQPPAPFDGKHSDADDSAFEAGVTVMAEDFSLASSKTIKQVRIWGGYYWIFNEADDDFTVIVHESDGGFPGTVIYQEGSVSTTKTMTGNSFAGFPGSFFGWNEWEFTLSLADPPTLDPGSYFVEVFNNTLTSFDDFVWEAGDSHTSPGHYTANQAPGLSWTFDSSFNLAIELLGDVVGGDCNQNLTPDECEVPDTSPGGLCAQDCVDDCDANGIPDECDIPSTFVGSSLELGPFGDGAPQAFALESVRPADGDVILSFTAEADLGLATKNVEVLINNSMVGTVFTDDGEDCDQLSETQLSVQAATFNQITQSGEAVIDMVASDLVASNECAGATYITVSVTYETASASADCNSNGIPDSCDITDGSPDENANGVPDSCDECVVDSDCADQAFCNGVEVCINGSCSSGAAPCSGQLCSEAARGCVACLLDSDCPDDGLYCNGEEMCVSGSCAIGPTPCPDQLCVEATQTCVNCILDSDCPDDGLFCNGTEECIDGQCHLDDEPCFNGECCDEESDSCGQCPCESAADCSDNDECTIDFCLNGQCSHTAISRCGDVDADGVPDEDDDCSNTPRDSDADANGCSCVQLDGDQDGVDDCSDQCPTTPAGVEVENDGCNCDELDDDNDGVNNCNDLFGGTPAGLPVNAEGAADSQLDDDQDGVFNTVDVCPATPIVDIADEQGCSFNQRQGIGSPPGFNVPQDGDSGQSVPGGDEASSSSSRRPAPCGLFGAISVVGVFAGLFGLRMTASRRRRLG